MATRSDSGDVISELSAETDSCQFRTNTDRTSEGHVRTLQLANGSFETCVIFVDVWMDFGARMRRRELILIVDRSL